MAKNLMTQRLSHIGLLALLLLFAAVLGVPFPAWARLSGEAELGYTRYDAQENGTKTVEGSSFYQRYSLMYATEGELYNGRFGRYDLSLGYEWGSFDTKIKSPANVAISQGNDSRSASAGHLLYRGEVVLDPQELPLRLRAYSYDLNRVTLYQDLTLMSGGNIIDSRLVSDLRDGTRISSGATLLFGVKSGLTNGYNAIFRHIPLVMLDYRDDITRDQKSLFPIDTRMRRLAFVSLNKRDNWFHYRTTDFTDNINPSQSFKETQVQLGTIDQALTRRWIDLTNWLKISADGQFTKHNSATPDNSFEAYDFNVFAIANRRDWDARTFSSFSRLVDKTGITLERTIPVYGRGVIGSGIEWKGNLYANEKRIRELDGAVVNNSDYSGTLRADMLRRSPFTLGVTAKAETSTNYGAKLFSLEGGLETASTARFSRDYSVTGGYTVKYFDSLDSKSEGGGYLNQNLNGRVAYTASPTFLVDVSEDLSSASGSNPKNFSNNSITINSGFYGGNSGISGSATSFQRRNNEINDYVRSITSVNTSWRPFSNTSISFSVSEDVLMQSGEDTDYLTTFRNSIDYNASTFLARLRNSYNIRMIDGESLDYMESVGTVEYHPNRYLEGLLTYTYSVGDVDANAKSEFIDLRQRLGYSIYASSGISRKLMELYEEFTYNRTKNFGILNSDVSSTRRFTLGARYFPLRSLYLGGDARFSLLDPSGVTEQYYTGVVGLNFRKFQANLEYSYGRRNDEDNRIEKRIAANVKKLF